MLHVSILSIPYGNGATVLQVTESPPNILTTPYSHCFAWDWWSDSSSTEPMKAGCTFVSSGHYRMSKSKHQKSTIPTNLFCFFSRLFFVNFFHFSNFLRNKTRILRFLSTGQSVYWTGKSKFSKIGKTIFSNFWLIRISVITFIANVAVVEIITELPHPDDSRF